jgi:hypothetical protein
MKQDRAETKRNEARHNRNETKPRKSSIDKKTKQTLTKQFFLQQSTKCQWRIEKPLKFSGIWENFVQPPSPPMYLVFFSDFQNVWIRYWKRKKYLHFRTQFCHLRFAI